MAFSMSSCPGKKCFLISSMISLALTIPLAMMSFMTFANLIFKSAASSLSLAHTSAERASSHLKLVAISMILAWTILMISLALVIPFLTASRTILSTSAALTFNFSAAFFKAAHTLSERISSQVMAFSMSSCPGKKSFLISSMISLALTIPLTMMSFMTAMTLANLIFKSAAISLSLAQTSAERASSHLKLVAFSMILAWTILMISLALVIPFLTASRTILSTSAALTFNFSAAFFKAAHTLSERISSQVMAFSMSSC